MVMKNVLIVTLLGTVLATSGYCQDRIYRCGNEYTNTVPSLSLIHISEPTRPY